MESILAVKLKSRKLSSVYQKLMLTYVDYKSKVKKHAKNIVTK